MSNEAGLNKQYIPQDRKCNVGVQVNLLPVRASKNPVLPFGSATLPIRRVEPNPATGSSNGKIVRASLNSQAFSNLKTVNGRPVAHTPTSVNTSSNHSTNISGLINGVNNSNVRGYIINPSMTATTIHSGHQLSSLPTTHNYARRFDPRLSNEKQSIFFSPPENIQKSKLVENFKPDVKFTKRPKGVKLIWTLANCTTDLDRVIGYDIYYAIITNTMQPSKVSWKLLNTVTPSPLPMMCDIELLITNYCYFAMRTKLKNDCYSPFSNICKVI